MQPLTSDDLVVARLLAEVQDLCANVRELISLTPSRNRIWLPPRDFARLAGVSTRTISSWRAQGRFRNSSLRKQGTGWLFHSSNALADLDSESRPKAPLSPAPNDRQVCCQDDGGEIVVTDPCHEKGVD